MEVNRRKHQCHKDNCDSQSLHQVCLRFWTIGPIDKRIELRCPSTIKVCDRHKRQAQEYVLSPSNKERIGMGLMKEGLPPPDFSSAEITFVPLMDGEAVEDLRVVA